MAGFRAICQEGPIAGIIIRRQESCNFRSAVPGGSITYKPILKSRIGEAEDSLAPLVKKNASMGRQRRARTGRAMIPNLCFKRICSAYVRAMKTR
jgi:hypothetical protein